MSSFRFHCVRDKTSKERLCGIDPTKGAALLEVDFRQAMKNDSTKKRLCQRCLEALEER